MAADLKPQSLKSVLEGKGADEDNGGESSEEYVVEDPYNPQAGASSEDDGSGDEASLEGDGATESGSDEGESDEEESEEEGSGDDDGMDVDA